MPRIQRVLTFLFPPLVLALFPALLFAQPSPETETGKFVQETLQAAQASQWRVFIALATIGIVFAVRKYGPSLIPALARGKWAWVVAIVTGALTGLSPALYHQTLTQIGLGGVLMLMGQGVFDGLVGAGLYSGGKKWAEKTAPAPTA